MVNFYVCLFNIFFGHNFRKNRTTAKKFWYVFQLHRFALQMKNFYCIQHRSFYRAFQKFQYINIFGSFLMTQIGTKFRYVFKLQRSDLHNKISHRIQHRFFLQGTSKFEYINAYRFLLKCTASP